MRVGFTNEFDKKRALVVFKNKRLVVYKHNESFYCMDAVCPHSGGPLHLGRVEFDIEDALNLTCPWHAYKFNSCTGKSIDNDMFEASVYEVTVNENQVFINYPENIDKVTVEFYDFKDETTIKNEIITIPQTVLNDDASLVDWAILILNTPDPNQKVALTFQAANKWFDGDIKTIGNSSDVPNRPARQENLLFLDRGKIQRKGKLGSLQSRIGMLHALANVEQWAIDLAWDIIARFSTAEFNQQSIQSQKEFFSDFVKVASEEAKHFTFLVDRLKALGSFFGALPVHDGLWDSALLTSHCLLSRLAIVHMVHEARGLDVNPNTIDKFRKAGDLESVEKLAIIHQGNFIY
jgi:uncharacterized ferritin-like protein (DUF455 family)/nitrite reductase/ring-hydroxylating ferredoxin subunit